MPGAATFFAFDVETSGLDPEKHEILSIAMMLTDSEFGEIKRQVVYALPKRIEDAESEALRINGYDFGIWTERGAVTQEEMLDEVCRFVRGTFRIRQIAHNHRFDEAFLKALYKRYRPDKPLLYKDTFSFHALDTIALGIFTDVALQGKLRKAYGLNALAECYGVVNASAHSAIDDVDCMVTTLRAMVKTIREAGNITPPPIEPAISGILKALDVDKDIWIFARGKHAGKLSHQVLEDDKSYLAYVLGFNDLAQAQRDHLRRLMDKK